MLKMTIIEKLRSGLHITSTDKDERYELNDKLYDLVRMGENNELKYLIKNGLDLEHELNYYEYNNIHNDRSIFYNIIHNKFVNNYDLHYKLVKYTLKYGKNIKKILEKDNYLLTIINDYAMPNMKCQQYLYKLLKLLFKYITNIKNKYDILEEAAYIHNIKIIKLLLKNGISLFEKKDNKLIFSDEISTWIPINKDQNLRYSKFILFLLKNNVKIHSQYIDNTAIKVVKIFNIHKYIQIR